jgi:hypothetical protein
MVSMALIVLPLDFSLKFEHETNKAIEKKMTKNCFNIHVHFNM